MICCDSCPYSPTCEELDEPVWGEEYEDQAADELEDPGAFEWGDPDEF